MAHIGMKFPVAAPWKEDGTYGEGFVVGKAINFTYTPNKNDVTLYADDDAAETDQSVKDLGTSLGIDDLDLKTLANLLGHTYVEAVTEGENPTPESVEASPDDVAPFFGVGFYKRRRKNSITSFTVIWLYKVQHSEPTENAETKGETTNFQTPTIEGKAFQSPVAGGDKKLIYKKLRFPTEAEAIAWLKRQANIGVKA